MMLMTTMKPNIPEEDDDKSDSHTSAATACLLASIASHCARELDEDTA
jgi:hypothetical protein